jgi:hypothetical protein
VILPAPETNACGGMAASPVQAERSSAAGPVASEQTLCNQYFARKRRCWVAAAEGDQPRPASERQASHLIRVGSNQLWEIPSRLRSC